MIWQVASLEELEHYYSLEDIYDRYDERCEYDAALNEKRKQLEQAAKQKAERE